MLLLCLFRSLNLKIPNVFTLLFMKRWCCRNRHRVCNDKSDKENSFLASHAHLTRSVSNLLFLHVIQTIEMFVVVFFV